MDLILPIFGFVIGGSAAALSFFTAGTVKEAGLMAAGRGRVEENLLLDTSRKIWISVACATGAGMIQAFEGDAFITLIWVLFLAVQCFNLHIVRTALLKK